MVDDHKFTWVDTGKSIFGSAIKEYPHRSQGFSYDCAPTAVLTVLHYYGFNNDSMNEQKVFDALGTDENGTDNDGVESGFKKLGMATERVFSIEDIDRHVESGHPVVVCAVTYPGDWHYMVVVARDGDYYVVSDPWAVTLVRVKVDIFDKVWHEEDGSRFGVAVLGEPKYKGGIMDMDVKLAGEIKRVAKDLKAIYGQDIVLNKVFSCNLLLEDREILKHNEEYVEDFVSNLKDHVERKFKDFNPIVYCEIVGVPNILIENEKDGYGDLHISFKFSLVFSVEKPDTSEIVRVIKDYISRTSK